VLLKALGASVVRHARMNLLSSILLSIVASLLSLGVPVTACGQKSSGEQNALSPDTPQKADAALLQKDDRGELMRAIKINEVPLAKEVLLRNGFTVQDLENAKITLRTGGGKKGEDEIEISATCCDPKEITIQRSLDYFTK
jgi:hypothetical protein